MLALFAVGAIAALGCALALALAGSGSAAVVAHVAFGAGILPLIFAAMLHFVPVLTRGRPPGRALQLLPLGALFAGILAAVSLSQPGLVMTGVPIAAGTGLLLTLLMAGWVVHRGRSALGAPHPGLYWYLAAVACLALGLLAATAMNLWPHQRLALRRFHLHLNTLGFVGLTALGTLAVLLPTAIGRPNPGVAAWLRRTLPWALAGVLLTAAGAAWWPPASIVGAVSLGVPAALLGAGWLRRFSTGIFRMHGTAPSLALALLGFLIMLVAGAVHGVGWRVAAPAPAGFMVAFLLPLVAGAASQLLPLWLKPGMQTPWHQATRETLGRHSALRSGAAVLAGTSIALGQSFGFWIAAAALGAFAIQILRVVLRR